jgi:hypothetical protein
LYSTIPQAHEFGATQQIAKVVKRHPHGSSFLRQQPREISEACPSPWHPHLLTLCIFMI